MARLIFFLWAFILWEVAGIYSLPLTHAVSYTEEVTGTITDLRWKHALQEPYFDICEMDVQEHTDKTITVLINQSTLIRDQLWHTAHAVYLQKGMKVKVLYVPTNDKPSPAQKIYVLEEPPH